MAERTKIDIAAELERARGGIARNFHALRADLDVPRYLKSSMTRHKTAYLGGAALLGIVASRLGGRRKKKAERKSKDAVKEVEKAGLGLMLLQMAFKAAQPALVSLVTRKLGDLARGRSGGSES